PPQVTYQSVPVPNRIQRKVFTRAYYMKAAATQFPLPEGMNLPLTLRHYWTTQTAFCIWTRRGCFWPGVEPFRCLLWCGG
ncbi:hypothetical protein NY749_07335, partial [Escherichia coli]|nr:hypothetical protein [Escherichia coli]